MCDVSGRSGIPSITAAEYGVETGTITSQTAAIHKAFQDNPGMPFLFPPGDYRLDQQLDIKHNNSIILAPGARIFAAASMQNLVNYDNGSSRPDEYAENRCFTGYGQLDGNLLAERVLRINAVLRFSINGLTLVNGVHRGLLADEHGGELHVRDVRILNTTTKNVADNVGIEAKMGDGRFTNISMRDITIAVWDRSKNYWMDIHPWLGTTKQLAARYQNSVAFILQGDSVLVTAYADTYRCSFRTQSDTDYVRARILAPEVYANPGNLTDELARTHPGVVLDIADSGGEIILRDGVFHGHSAAPFTFVRGNVRRLTSSGNMSPGGLTGLVDYRSGVILGKTEFSPTLYGSDVAGSQKYTMQYGLMEVREGAVSYQFKIKAALGAEISGHLRIGGFPMPANIAFTNAAVCGSLNLVYGGLTCDAVIRSGVTEPLELLPIVSVGGAQVVAADFAGKDVELWGQVDSPFDGKA